MISEDIKKILLLTNFRPDNQRSMVRFGKLLVGETDHSFDLEISEIFPHPVLTRIISKGKLFKWTAYLDKYLLFSRQLPRKIAAYKDSLDLVHVIDHSNAIYLPLIKKVSSAKLLVTCHDLIAVRTALGEFQNAPQISPTGKRLQSWIRSSLNYADYYSCDSNQTKQDLNRLIPKSTPLSTVIHLGTQSQHISDQSSLFFQEKLPFDPTKTDFILHVGSSAWYKNRKAVFQSFYNAFNKQIFRNLKLVLVGPEPQDHEVDLRTRKWIEAHQDSVIRISNLGDASLRLLYRHAKVLVFPSHAEGFGWPPLEAALQGCPVITTRSGAIHDLLGDYPKYVQPIDQDSIDKTVLDTLQLNSRKSLKIALPDNEKCRCDYYKLYSEMFESNC